jgi:hypothetical protein
VRFIAFTLWITFLAAAASAQTTRQSPQDVPVAWEKQITSLAAAIAAKDGEAIQTLVGPDCQIRKFNSERDIDLSEFTDFATAISVLGDHAYISPALSAATDIADDINSSPIITPSTKHSLALDPKRDQTTVLQWITAALNTQDGTLVGLIVLWDPRPDIEDHHRPNFILVTGEKSGDAYKLNRISFGDPLQ